MAVLGKSTGLSLASSGALADKTQRTENREQTSQARIARRRLAMEAAF
jgi:hypothetical protein